MTKNNVEDGPEVNAIRHNGAPDRFIMVSGGMDSVAMAHYTIAELGPDWGPWNKQPTVVYLDTTLGVSSQRVYTEMLCDEYEWPLITARTPFDFEGHTEEEGFYTPKQHDKIFNKLKGLPTGRLSTAAGNPHFYFGTRRAESENRSDVKAVKYKDSGDIRGWVHNPLYDWEDEDVVDYLIENEIPPNPNWESNHFTDCGCGATASYEELIELEAEGHVVMAHKLRQLQDSVERDDSRSVWAPHSFDPELVDERMERSSVMCGPSCSAKSNALNGESGLSDGSDGRVNIRYICSDCDSVFVAKDRALDHECGEVEVRT